MKDQQEIGVIDEQDRRGVFSNDPSQGPRSWGARGDHNLQTDEYGGEGEDDDETMARGEILSNQHPLSIRS
jgi:hypothetical protein